MPCWSRANIGLKLKPKLRTSAACRGWGGVSDVLSPGSGRYHPKSVPSEVELKLSRCAVWLRHCGCKNAELYFLDSDALRSRIPDHNSSSATERQMMRKECRNDTFVPGENVEEILRVNQVFQHLCSP